MKGETVVTKLTEAKETVKELRSGEPVVATKAAGKIIAEVDFKKPVPKPKIKPKPKTIRKNLLMFFIFTPPF